MKINDEIKSLFKKVRLSLGGGVVDVQLTDETLCTLLEIAIEDYSSFTLNKLVEWQWANLYGKNVSNMDMAYALSTRTMDIANQYSYWFSKEVGLQQRGPWELKKDFITIELGKQSYIIPAGREINKVMYVNPPLSQAALFANYGGFDIGFGGGYAQLGGGAYGPVGGFFTAPAADVAYLATDLTYKSRLLRGDLTYNITAGPDGTRILHLYSTPGSKLSFGYMGNVGSGLGLVGCQVWYSYYDTTPDNVDECRRMNKGDIVMTPDQVPLKNLEYEFFNEPTQTIIRQLLIAKAKETLGIIRGTYNGKVPFPMAELMMDYQMLLTQGKEEYKDTMGELEKRLERMDPLEILKRQAEIVEATKQVQAGKPMLIYPI